MPKQIKLTIKVPQHHVTDNKNGVSMSLLFNPSEKA
jgi:hypothetical protein